MGFAYDTAITDETMFFSVGFEQELSNILRQTGKTDFSDLEKQAVNLIIRDLKSRAVDPSDVSNTRDFTFEVIFWVLKTLYLGEEPDQFGRKVKHEEYRKAWEEQVATRYIVLTSTGEEVVFGQQLGLPSCANIDQGAFFPSLENRGEVLRMSGLIKNFDKNVFNRPL